MDISASLVKELRQKTGAGLMNCKKALLESNGNIEESIKFLREKGLATASKKADRSANEGRIFIQSASDQKQSLVIEVNCETDFVASNNEFLDFGNKVAKSVLENNNIKSSDDLSEISFDGKNYDDLISEYTVKLGEKIGVGKFKRISSEAPIHSYIHSNGKIGTAVSFSGSVEEGIGKSVAMQVAASNPTYVSSATVDKDEIDKERDIIRQQAKNEGRPDQVIEKIVEGRIAKYYKEVCLLEQPFIMDDKKAIKEILPNQVTIEDFTRFSIG
ncbi:elongation factor Ts [Candidatus Marinamargulisbacteria bacterium SCGC AAA071-K20]|nr:elongation factor Ts [Candidatus Marinamargulisbacteria bacterium SCGC AAA071-K20]